MYEAEPRRVDVFDRRLRRIIAAIILLVVLIFTWRWITFSFIEPQPAPPKEPTFDVPLAMREARSGPSHAS